MVALSTVHTSNALIGETFPPGLVAVFVGATSGIGEITLKTLAKYAKEPRIYLVGRSQSAADRIITECKDINPKGDYIFISADVSLIQNVEKLCEDIKQRESSINLLFLSSGAADMSRSGKPTHFFCVE